MAKYMIQDSHEAGECVRLLDEFLRAGAHYLTRAEWGCQDGDHTGWIMVEADSDADARLMVPPVIRTRVRPVRLNQFTPEKILALHETDQVGAGD